MDPADGYVSPGHSLAGVFAALIVVAVTLDGVYDMFLVSAPLNAPGGIGSPADAVAIK